MCCEAGLRGRFQIPIQLDERVYQYLCQKARARGVPLEDLVNDLLKKCIELSWRMES